MTILLRPLMALAALVIPMVTLAQDSPQRPEVRVEADGTLDVPPPGFSLAGVGLSWQVAILAGILSVLSAPLLTLMLLIFEIALVPIIFAYHHVHQAWGATAYNLTVAGAAWIFAVSLANQQTMPSSPSVQSLAP